MWINYDNITLNLDNVSYFVIEDDIIDPNEDKTTWQIIAYLNSSSGFYEAQQRDLQNEIIIGFFNTEEEARDELEMILDACQAEVTYILPTE